MDMQNVSNLIIPEGEVKAIYDSNSRLLWARLNYDTKYAGNTLQQTYSGKNLLPNEITSQTFHGVTITRNADGSLILNGLVDSGGTSYNLLLGKIPITSGATYTISGVTGWNYNTLQLFATSSVAFPAGNRLQCSNGPQTATAQGNENISVRLYMYAGQNYDNVVIYPMVEQSASVSPYEPYVGDVPSPNPDYPQDVNVVTGEQTITITDGTNTQNFIVDLGTTELCKIGTYQDYIYKSGDDWYVHKETLKYVYSDSSQTAYFDSSIPRVSFNKPTNIVSSNLSYCNQFTFGDSETTNNKFNFGSTRVFMHSNEKMTSSSNWNSWMGQNPVVFYFPLTNPVNTQITDQTLIDQLDSVHQFLTRYGYNATVTGNLPLIVDRTNL